MIWASVAPAAAMSTVGPRGSSAWGRTVAGWLALISLPAYVLIDGALALLRGWKPETRLESGLLAACLVWVAAATLVALVPVGRRFYARCAPQLVGLACGTIFALAAAELALNWVGGVTDITNFHRRRPNLAKTFNASPEIMPGVKGPTHFTINSQGIRAPEMPPRDQALRVLCIGGSTTECMYLDDADAWPTLLSSMLADAWKKPTWSGSVGISGYYTGDHLRLVRDSKLLNDLDVAIFLVGANDLNRALNPTPLPAWYQSQIVGFIRRLFLLHMKVDVEDETGSSYIARRAARAQAAKTDDLPDITADLRQYQDRIRALAETCRKRGIRPVFMTQPNLSTPDLPSTAADLMWLGRLKDGRYLTVPAYEAVNKRYNEALLEVCREIGAECIDVAAQMDGRIDYFYDDWHYNVAGSHALAQLIADYARSHPPTERAEAE